MAASTGPNLSIRDVASIIGRNQGPELFFQQAFVALQSPIIPKALLVNRPCERIHLVWRGRVVVGVADYTAVAAEAPATIIQRIRLTGTHARYGSLTPIDISGATMFAYARMFRVRGNSLYINGTRQPDPNVPYAMPVTAFGAVGTYDLEIHYSLPFVPLLALNSKPACAPFMLMSRDWGDTLQLQVFFGDQTSFGTPAGGTTITFSAFGSGAGTPTLTIYQNFELLGPIAPKVTPAVMIRNEQTIAGGTISAVANQVRLLLLQKQKTTNIMFKTGTLLTGSASGVSVFGTLQDDMLDFTQPIVDNKPIRNNFNNFAEKEYAGFAFNTVVPGGYNNFTFVDSQSPLTYYRGDLLDGGSTFELDTNVILAPANASCNVMQEQVVGDPIIA